MDCGLDDMVVDEGMMKEKTIVKLEWRRRSEVIATYEAIFKTADGLHEYMATVTQDSEIDGWRTIVFYQGSIIHISEHVSRDSALMRAHDACWTAVELREGGTNPFYAGFRKAVEIANE